MSCMGKVVSDDETPEALLSLSLLSLVMVDVKSVHKAGFSDRSVLKVLSISCVHSWSDTSRDRFWYSREKYYSPL